MHPGGNCPVNTIRWKDENENDKELETFDIEGVSKGLKKIALELGYTLKEKIKLDEVKTILKDHPGANA